MLGFHYGFSGDIKEPVSAPLVSTFGFNLRGDVPVEKYLVLGPLFQFGTWRPDTNPAPDRSYYVDIDFYPRVRLPITTPKIDFQLWAGVPIGLTLDFWGPDVPGVSTVGIGWNYGLMLGGAVHFTPKIGLFTEVGWVQHKATHDSEPNLYLHLSQWVLNVGFVFRD